MSLPKGRTNNPKGRPKGKANKVTASTKDWINTIINSSRSQLEADLLKLEPRDRWSVMEKLLGYIIPKQQATTATIELNNLTDIQIDEIVRNITKTIKS